MEAQKYLSLTPDQKGQRKQDWKNRQKQITEQNRTPADVLAQERATKALHFLAQDYIKPFLKDIQRDTYAAIVLEYSRNSFFFFAKYVLDFDLLSDRTHRGWADNLQQSILLGKKRVMRLKPRATYKSSLYGIAFILWLWGCYSPQIRLFYTSSNALLLNEVSDKVNQYIGSEKSETIYSSIFGITKDVNAKNTSDVFNIKGRSGKGFSLILRTAGGNTVGIHPNVIVVDDPCFTGDTPILTNFGYKKIKNVVVGDMVLTRKGYRKVISSGITKYNAIVYPFVLNNKLLRSTSAHKIITKDSGKVKLCDLSENNIIIKYEDNIWKSEKLERPKSSISMGLDIEDTQNRKIIHIGNILWQAEMWIGKFRYCIERFGYSLMVKFLEGFISIIKKTTTTKTASTILKYYQAKYIIPYTQKNIFRIENLNKKIQSICVILDMLRANGISRKKAENLPGRDMQIQNYIRRDVKSVVESFMYMNYLKQGKKCAQEVVGCQNIKDSVYRVIATKVRIEDVYNLTIEDCHEFIANGILVSNCDNNDRESEACRQQKERWFDSLTPLLVPFRYARLAIEFKSIYYIGTRWHMKDLCNHIFEVNERLSEDQKWDIEVESIYNEDGHSAYPEIMTDDDIANIKANISEEFFAAQFLNEALPEGLQIFNLDKLSFIRPGQLDIAAGQNLCVFDPSKGKTHSDFPAVWWINYDGKNITFFDAIDKKIELPYLMPMIATRNKEYQCRTMIYENNGVTLIEEGLKDAHKAIGWDIFIDSVHHSGDASKRSRIISMQPDLYSGFARFMDDYENRYPEAMSQIVFYPVWGHDDFPDCAQIAVEYFRKPQFEFTRYEEML